MNRTLAVLLYSAGCGLLLVAFSMISGLIKFAFSLGAFFLGLRFFGQFSSWGVRFTFIGVSVLFYFLFIVIYIFIAFANGWHIPGAETVE